MTSTPVDTDRMREFAAIIFERNVSEQAMELSEALRRSANELDELREEFDGTLQRINSELAAEYRKLEDRLSAVRDLLNQYAPGLRRGSLTAGSNFCGHLERLIKC